MRLSILIATYNRAAILEKTLAAMTRVDCDGIIVDWVVVDNNSSDNTSEVLARYEQVLPLTTLFEGKPGKNAALNSAIERIGLNEIVVFSDDDVIPDRNWLREICRSAQEKGESDVFGGQVRVVWPHDQEPGWAASPGLRRWAFGEHHLSDAPGDYPESRFPCGPNFWVRKRVLDDGMRYEESIGPKPTGRIMGSETSFLMRLRREGYHFTYWPNAIVGHCIQPNLVTAEGIRRKAAWNGRWIPRVSGPRPVRLYSNLRPVWYLYRVGALAWSIARLAIGYCHPFTDRRITRTVQAIREVNYNLESLQLAWQESSDWPKPQ